MQRPWLCGQHTATNARHALGDASSARPCELVEQMDLPLMEIREMLRSCKRGNIWSVRSTSSHGLSTPSCSVAMQSDVRAWANPD